MKGEHYDEIARVKVTQEFAKKQVGHHQAEGDDEEEDTSEMVLCPILWGINLSHIYAREVR